MKRINGLQLYNLLQERITHMNIQAIKDSISRQETKYARQQATLAATVVLLDLLRAELDKAEKPAKK